MSRTFLFLVLFIFPFVAHAQIDQRKLDSLRKSIDSSAAAHGQWQDSFAKAQDSVYQQAIRKTVDNEKRSEELQKKQVERQRILQGMIALLIITAVLFMLRHRKKKST